jgi:hypothetical protein
MAIIQGGAVMMLGFLMLVFRPQIKRFIGNVGFAERYLGPGGTWTFLLILGVGFFIIGLMWSTGTLQNFFWGRLGGIF